MQEGSRQEVKGNGSRGGVVLLSGGVDSVTLLHYTIRELRYDAIWTISFDYGQKHRRELDMAAWQAARAGVRAHKVVDLTDFAALTRGGSALTDGDMAVPDLDAIPESERMQPPTYVPNRNLTLLSLAAAYAESVGARTVFYGAQAQDEYGYWDCTVDFVAKINDLLALNRRHPVTVQAPFVDRRKADVVRIGLRLGVDYAHTWTCYRGAEKACGTCPSCIERQRAFAEAGCAAPVSDGCPAPKR